MADPIPSVDVLVIVVVFVIALAGCIWTDHGGRS
jgi:uncharacterized membrane protein YqjE